jgi:Fic family protein
VFSHEAEDKRNLGGASCGGPFESSLSRLIYKLKNALIVEPLMKKNFQTMRSTGRYVQSTTLGETVRAFVPHPLPPRQPDLAADSHALLNLAAERALLRLEAVAGLVPSVDWLLYSAIRREALLTSQIEGTQATLVDLFDDEAGLVVHNRADVEEVTNYLRAFRWVQSQLRDPAGLPISVRLLCEAHRLLMDGVRGAGKQPGELRRSQNWIGGIRPGRAVFVPPPPELVTELLGDLERFIHDPQPGLPPLVKVALVHVQFETIHPFLDGNGRIGRLLIAALVEHWGLLNEPLMYLSGFLKQHQRLYYQRLSEVRTDGNWEAWVSFFLEGVETSAHQAEQSILAQASLIHADRRKLLAAPKASAVAYRLFELLPTMPRFTIEGVRQALDTTFPTATAAVNLLEGLGIVTETTGQKKNRSYSYAAYIGLMAD